MKAVIQYVQPPDTSGRAMNDALRAANAGVVAAWEEKFEPQHFTVAGGQKYGYQKRSGEDEPKLIPSRKPGLGGARRMINNPKYFWRKIRQGFGRTPLVRTGVSREAAKAIKITATAAKATGAFPIMPKYFWQYRDRAPHKGEELTTVLDSELAELAKVHAATAAATLQQRNAPKTITL